MSITDSLQGVNRLFLDSAPFKRVTELRVLVLDDFHTFDENKLKKMR